MEFLAGARRAVEAKLSDPEATQILIKRLVYEGSVPERIAAIAPVKKYKKIKTYLNVGVCHSGYRHRHDSGCCCSDEGIGNSLKGALIYCKKLGHFAKQCPRASPPPPKSKCPRCWKEFHWVKDCHSRFDKHIRPLNGKQQPAASPPPRESAASEGTRLPLGFVDLPCKFNL